MFKRNRPKPDPFSGYTNPERVGRKPKPKPKPKPPRGKRPKPKPKPPRGKRQGTGKRHILRSK